RGDDFLRSFAAILRESAGEGGTAGRLSGVQFAMLIPDPERALAVSERIGSALHRLLARDFGGVEMDVAVGIVPGSEASDPGRLIRLAYRAMRQSRVPCTGISNTS